MTEPTAKLEETVFLTSSFWCTDLSTCMSWTSGGRTLVGRESAEDDTCLRVGSAGWFVGRLETLETTRALSCACDTVTLKMKTNATRADK